MHLLLLCNTSCLNYKEGLKEEKQKSTKKEEMTDNIIENKKNKMKMKQAKAYGK